MYGLRNHQIWWHLSPLTLNYRNKYSHFWWFLPSFSAANCPTSRLPSIAYLGKRRNSSILQNWRPAQLQLSLLAIAPPRAHDARLQLPFIPNSASLCWIFCQFFPSIHLGLLGMRPRARIVAQFRAIHAILSRHGVAQNWATREVAQKWSISSFSDRLPS
jgi:hypothetical protein